MEGKFKIDYFFIFLVFFLLFWGFFEIVLVSTPFSLTRFRNPSYYSFRQLIHILIGIVFSFIIYILPSNFIKRHIKKIFLFSLFSLLLVFFPKIGHQTGGAARWINIFGFSFQPSEFFKITFILYISLWLTNRGLDTNIKKKKYLWETFFYFFTFILIISFLFYLQKDMGTMVVLAVVISLLYFYSSKNILQPIFLIILEFVLGIIFLYSEGYRIARLKLFLNPNVDPLGLSYQFLQGLYALGSGGLFGIEKGFAFGLSKQKFGFLPQAMGDSIFCIIGEELGFLGTLFLVLLFLTFFLKIVKLSNKIDSNFEKLSVIGIGFWFIIQAFLNIGGLIRLLPLTGVPLPFFTYGGSHIIAELMGIGIILNFSKNYGKN
ncbi:MAG: FtsW/RodA/SpoVE family cell cycle protein [Minisyncoccia bacterium]